MIEYDRVESDLPVLLVRYAGRVTVEEVDGDDGFLRFVERCSGYPFRIVCDFSDLKIMTSEVAERFLQGQAHAVARGMDRDAFVTTSELLRLQLTRVATESARSERLGEPRWFSTLDAALDYVRE